MTKGIVVPHDATAPLELREFSELGDYQQAVGGWIEAVDVASLGVTVYVNEEGLLQHLPLNSRATFLWWFHVPEARHRAMLVGDVVLVGMPDRKGDSTDIPAELSMLLRSDGPFAVLTKVGADPARYADPASKVASIVLPLASGEPNWFVSSAQYYDYFSAAVWAMVLLERWEDAVDTKVVPILDLPAHIQSALAREGSE